MISPVSFQSSPDAFAIAQEGMRRGLARFSQAAADVVQNDATPENMVGLIEGQRVYEMNAKVLRTADEMLGTLLNVFA